MKTNNLSAIANKDKIPFSKGYSLVASLNVPEWFLKFKRLGFETYLKNYNSVNSEVKNFIEKDDFKLLDFDVLPSLDMFLKYQMPDVEAYTIVIVNGRYYSDFSTDEELPFSVFSDGIACSLNDDSEFLDGKLKCDDNALVALNSAYLSNGVVIDIADGEKLLKPIHIISIVISDDEKFFVNPRIFVNVGKNISVDIIESNLSFDEKYFENKVCQFNIGKNSNVNHYKYYNVSGNSLLAENNFFNIETSSKFNQAVFYKKAGVVNSFYEFDVKNRASAESNISLFAKLKENFDMTVHIKHKEDDATSNVSLFATLDDEARVNFTTSVECEKNVKGIDTKQLSKMLINSSRAVGRIKPFQNIASEKVKAYHGAVMSGIQENDLFFLESRGIDRDTAKNLILKSCLCGMLQKIYDEKIYDVFYNLICL